MHHYLTYTDDKSNKFWEINSDSNSFTVRYGKIGTEGTSQTKTFDSEETCQKEANKLLNEKLKKRYKESDPKNIDSNIDKQKHDVGEKQKRNVGDIVAIPLSGGFFKMPELNGKYAFAKVFNDYDFGFYDLLLDHIPEITKILERSIVFYQAGTDEGIENGTWKIIGHQAFDNEEGAWAPPRITYYDWNENRWTMGEPYIYHKGKERKATPEEVQGLGFSGMADIDGFVRVVYERLIKGENRFYYVRKPEEYIPIELYKILFNKWSNAILEKIDVKNEYYNLIEGITDEQVADNKTIDAENNITIPDELIELYKIYNVEYTPVTSAFSFTPKNSGWYHLISFEDIQQHWEDIQDLQYEDSLEEGNLDNYSPKVKADDYANPRWIPFADSDNGDYLLFDTDPSGEGTYGQIIELINDTWERNVVAISLQELLKNQIDLVKKSEPKDFWDFILGKETDENVEMENQSDNKDEKSEDKESHSEITINFPVPKIVKFKDIKHLVPKEVVIWRWEESEPGSNDDVEFLLFDSDVSVENIDLDNPEETFNVAKLQDLFGIIITGNFTAKNIFNDNTDGSKSLIVHGNLLVENTVIGGQELYVGGNLKVKDLFWGNYNHGSTYIKGAVSGRLYIMSEQYNFKYNNQNNDNQIEHLYYEESEGYELEDDTERMVELAGEFFEEDLLFYKIDTIDDEDYEDITFWSDVVNRADVIRYLSENKNVLFEQFDYVQKDPKSEILKLKDAYKNIVSYACKQLSSTKKKELYEIINNLELEEGGEIDFTEIFETLNDKISDKSIDFILYFDCKTEARDVLFRIKNVLKNNFDIDNALLPKEEDYYGKIYVIEDVLFDIELALLKIDSMWKNGYKLTYIDIESDGYFVILHDGADKGSVQIALEKIGFESRYNEKEDLLVNDHSQLPVIFTNKTFNAKTDIKIQTENYNKVFEIYNKCEKYYNEAELDLSKLGIKVFVQKSHKRESDGKDVDESVYFLMDSGVEIFVWKPRTNLISGLFKDKNSIEVLYKNTDKNIFQYRPIFDVPEAEQDIFSFNFAWQEFLTTIERSHFYYNNLKEIATVDKIRNIVNLPVVQEKYNDYHDADKFPWFNNYCFAFDWTEEKYVTIRISKEINNSSDFDCLHFYYDSFHDNHIRVRYNSSQNNSTKDFYSESGTAIRFLDYSLFKKATEFFEEGEKLIVENNEEYLEEKQEELQKQEREFQKQIERKEAYKVEKPFKAIEINGNFFTLKDRKEAALLLKDCKDFNGDEIYDTFDMAFDGDEEEDKSFFLVAENEVQMDRLYLDTVAVGLEDKLYILGYIFTKKVTIEKYVEAYDMDFSMPIICLDDAEIGSLLLSGTTHYFHKNLKANNIQGDYNHGELIVKGNTEANLIVVDDFAMKFMELSIIAIVSDADRNVMVYNNLEGFENLQSELNYLPATHKIEKCIKDEYIFLDTERDEYKFLGGFWDSDREMPEGKDGFYDLLRKNTYLLDDNKLNIFYTDFVKNSFEKAKGLFDNNPKLKNLPIGEIYNEYPAPDFTHEYFFYQSTDTHYIIGYWNTWYHLTVTMCFDKINNKTEHSITVGYWDKENNIKRYNYNVALDEITYYRSMGQKVFFEAVELISKA